jgi:hypothetical protein
VSGVVRGTQRYQQAAQRIRDPQPAAHHIDAAEAEVTTLITASTRRSSS